MIKATDLLRKINGALFRGPEDIAAAKILGWLGTGTLAITGAYLAPVPTAVAGVGVLSLFAGKSMRNTKLGKDVLGSVVKHSKAAFSLPGSLSSNSLMNFAAGGIGGGIMSKMNGGEFKEGFAYGGLTSAMLGSRTLSQRPISRIGMQLAGRNKITNSLVNLNSSMQRRIVGGISGTILGGTIGAKSNQSKARGLNAVRGQRI